MLGTALSKKEDRLKEAASLMLKSGNFQEYCEIMMHLKEYEAAMAVAPKVSLKYWQSCVHQYTQYLKEVTQKPHLNEEKPGQRYISLKLLYLFIFRYFDPESEMVDYLILLSKVDEAASLLHNKGETQHALMLKSL